MSQHIYAFLFLLQISILPCYFVAQCRWFIYEYLDRNGTSTKTW